MFPDGRGGSKHKPAPLVDESRIAAVLGKHKDLVADMKQYENVGRSRNPNGPGLMLLFDFLADLIVSFCFVATRCNQNGFDDSFGEQP